MLLFNVVRRSCATAVKISLDTGQFFNIHPHSHLHCGHHHHTNQPHVTIVTIIIIFLIINLNFSSNPMVSLTVFFRTNLAKNYIALVLAAFINAGLLEVSTEIFLNFFTQQTDLIQLCLILANVIR